MLHQPSKYDSQKPFSPSRTKRAKKSLCKITFASKKEISINDKLETANDKKSAGEILNLVKINNEAYNSLAVLRKDMLNKNLAINGATVEIMEQVTKND